MLRLAALVVVAAALLSSSAGARTSTFRWPFTYDDPVGDANGGADVTKIEKGGDTAAGIAGLRLTVENFATDAGLDVYLNTDLDPATGNNGNEYLFVLHDTTWTFNKADTPQTWVRATHSSRTSVFRDGDVYEVHIDPADIGGTTYFRFQIVTFHPEPGDAVPPVLTVSDRAPDRGSWEYALGEIADAPHPAPTIQPLGAQPATPRVAKQFTVSYAVTDPEAGGPATGAKVTVSMTIAGKALPTTSRFRDGVVVAHTLIPPHAHQKLLVVRVSATVGTRESHRQVGYRIP